jgi:hypothetical protein|tara:strand:+ start:2047 stop:3378 length:1332 start_codon:yes stop_codon:yes gene_type:complete
MCHDMIEVEKMGKPAVPIVSGRFEDDALASSRTFGMPDLQFVIVPRIYRNLADDLCVSQTEDAIDDLIASLTSDETQAAQSESDESILRFEGEDRYDAVLKMNQEFTGRDWSDALPIWPPTREAVEKLIEGTNLNADDVVCDMPPGFGIATVEQIAINSAMAGAKPEHMPIIIAAVKCLSVTGGHGGKSMLMSTSPQAPMLVVNGPIARKIGLNGGSALGPGRENEINITIGRAFYLCLKNIGMWYPHKMDMDTIGTTRKFVPCLAENEAASPWASYAADRGFSDDQSAVSIFTTNGELDVQDQGNTSAEGLLKTLAYGITFGNRSVGHLQSQERLIFMPPDVALPVAAEGWSKEDAKNFIFEHAYGSLGKFIQFMPVEDARVEEEWQWIRDKTEQELLETNIPLLADPDKIDIVVLGADRAKTLVFPTGPSAETVGIDQYLP